MNYKFKNPVNGETGTINDVDIDFNTNSIVFKRTKILKPSGFRTYSVALVIPATYEVYQLSDLPKDLMEGSDAMFSLEEVRNTLIEFVHYINESDEGVVLHPEALVHNFLEEIM